MNIIKAPIIPVFSLALLVFFCSVGVYFMVGRGIVVNARVLEEKTRELNGLKSQEERIREFEKARSRLQGKLQLLEGFFVDSNNPIEFLEFLEATAKDLSIEVVPETPSKLPQDAFASMTFNVHTKGSYVSSLKFLEILENAPYLLEVRDVNMVEAKEASTGRNVDFILRIKTYTK